MSDFVWNPPSIDQVHQSIVEADVLPQRLLDFLTNANKTLVQPTASAVSAASSVYYNSGIDGYTRPVPIKSFATTHQTFAINRCNADTSAKYTRYMTQNSAVRDVFFMDLDGNVAHYTSGVTLGHIVRVFYVCAIDMDYTQAWVMEMVYSSSPQAGTYTQKYLLVNSGLNKRAIDPVLSSYGLVPSSSDNSGYAWVQKKQFRGVEAEVSINLTSHNDYLLQTIAGAISYLTVEKTPSFHNTGAILEIYRNLTYVNCVTLEALGLDLNTLDYVGDTSKLEDPVYYGFVDYVKNNPESARFVRTRNFQLVKRQIEDYVKSSDPVIVSHADMGGEYACMIGVAKNKVTSALDKLGCNKEEYKEVIDSLVYGLKQGSNLLEIVGSSDETVFDLTAKQYTRLYGTCP